MLLPFLFIFACSDNHDHNKQLTGKELYKIHCANCHKESGTGKFLKGVPPSKYTQLTPQELIKKITQGETNKSKMQIFNTMPKEEADKIAIFVIHELKKQ